MPKELEVFEHLTQSLDEGYGIDVIYLDYRKAFDTVPHHRLIYKLQLLGFHGKLLIWLQSFLTNRLMRVVVNGQYSTWSKVKWSATWICARSPIVLVVCK